jgi:hypothetical protein
MCRPNASAGGRWNVLEGRASSCACGSDAVGKREIGSVKQTKASGAGSHAHRDCTPVRAP